MDLLFHVRLFFNPSLLLEFSFGLRVGLFMRTLSAQSDRLGTRLDLPTSAHIFDTTTEMFWCLISTSGGISLASTTCLRKRINALRGRGI